MNTLQHFLLLQRHPQPRLPYKVTSSGQARNEDCEKWIPTESPQDALKREIREELQTEIEVGELLTTAGYIAKETDGSGTKPRTICKMTDTGREAMQKYVEALKTYFAGL